METKIVLNQKNENEGLVRIVELTNTSSFSNDIVIKELEKFFCTYKIYSSILEDEPLAPDNLIAQAYDRKESPALGIEMIPKGRHIINSIYPRVDASQELLNSIKFSYYGEDFICFKSSDTNYCINSINKKLAREGK